jgi:hypothetical protein
MAGYSGTPLAAKLGIKEQSEIFVVGAPEGYRELLEPFPSSVRFAPEPSASTDMVHLFATKHSELAQALTSYRKLLSPQTVVWVSWPKKAARVPTEITEDAVREVALPLGFVDVKVCAVNEVWSGLKLVVRKELRNPTEEKQG